MLPIDLAATLGPVGTALLFGAIGAGFGAALEMGGFGDTRKLAAQFYLKDMTVLKVMFTGMIVAAVLIAGATAFGLLDMSRVWINPTYLWPGIVGGLIMGVGFVLGGFCPGTSIVAASTLKVDGMVFLVGVLTGIWAFGETVSGFQGFFFSSAMGRFTLADWLGLPVGATLLLLVAMALLLFWLGDLAVARFGQGKPWAEISLRPGRTGFAAAAALVLATVVVMARGQPTPAEKFALLGPAAAQPVEDRSIFVHPAEVVALRKDLNLQVNVVDLRDEHDFNLFHLGGARRVAPGDLARPAVLKGFLDAPASTVTFLVGNGEPAELAAWKELKALGANNLYVLDGGIDRWLELYPVPACIAERAVPAPADPDALAWRFAYATGSSLPAAWPELPSSPDFRSPCGQLVATEGEPEGGEHEGIVWPTYAFQKKVKLKAKVAVKGGCG